MVTHAVQDVHMMDNQNQGFVTFGRVYQFLRATQ